MSGYVEKRIVMNSNTTAIAGLTDWDGRRYTSSVQVRPL